MLLILISPFNMNIYIPADRNFVKCSSFLFCRSNQYNLCTLIEIHRPSSQFTSADRARIIGPPVFVFIILTYSIQLRPLRLSPNHGSTPSSRIMNCENYKRKLDGYRHLDI